MLSTQEERRSRQVATIPGAHGAHLRRTKRARTTADGRGPGVPQSAGAPSSRGRATSSKITIVLAEGEHLIRCGIRCLLELEADLEIIGEAEDGLDVATLVTRLKPRILVVPVAMPGLNGLEIARQVRQQSPETAVIVLSRYSNEEYVIQALRNGVLGYVLKYARPAELVRAIHRVVGGRRYLSEPLSDHPLETWLARAQDGALDAYDTLTDREREVLQLVAEGHKSAVIAKRLSISSRTVEAHRASVMRKMGFPGLVDLILFAIARGILVRPVTVLARER